MQMLNAEQAAELLHVNVKRVQSLARAGKIPATRVGRKWLFPRQALEQVLGAPHSPTPAAFEGLSARNHLVGRVVALQIDGLMAEVRLAIGDQELVSIITRSSCERLGLTVGDDVYAVIKSTEVMIGRG